jgi:hypothetical protein
VKGRYLLLIALAIVFAGMLIEGVRKSQTPAEQMLEPQAVYVDPSRLVESWGAERPTVRLQAVLPRGNPMAERCVAAMRSITDRYPLDASAEVIDMTQPGHEEAMAQRGIRTPLLAVNARTEFDIQLEGKPVHIQLTDLRRLRSLPIDHVLDAIVEQEMRKAKTAGAPGPR